MWKKGMLICKTFPCLAKKIDKKDRNHYYFGHNDHNDST